VRERVKPEDLVVIYIASHGSPRTSDPNGVSYVITHDTKLDSAANLYATSLQMIDLVELLRRDVKARRVVLILDTCFSGDATGERGVAVHTSDNAAGPAAEFSIATDRFEDKTQGAARVVISASRANEQSREDETLKHGYFTYFLLEALKENGGKSTLKDVFQFVHDRTVKAVHEKFGAQVSQTPTMRNTPEGLGLVLGVVPGGG
jgi:helicase